MFDGGIGSDDQVGAGHRRRRINEGVRPSRR
jgi:hypothetical protein